MRRLIDIDGTDEFHIVADFNLERIVRRVVELAHVLLVIELQLPLPRRALQNREELAEVMLDPREIHLLEADQEELILILLPLRAHQKVHKTRVRRVVNHMCEVHIAEKVSVIAPGRAHRHHEHLAVLKVCARIEAERLRVDVNERGFSGAAEPRENHKIAALHRRVEVHKITPLIVAAALLRVVLHHVENQRLVLFRRRNLLELRFVELFLQLLPRCGLTSRILCLLCRALFSPARGFRCPQRRLRRRALRGSLLPRLFLVLLGLQHGAL